MNYEVLQDAVVERLQPLIAAGVQASRIPDNDGEKEQVLPGHAKFTVIVAGSEYSETNSTAQVRQDEKIFVQVLIESSSLYGSKGIYSLVSVLKAALTGFKAQGTTRFQVSKHHMIGNPEGEKVNNMWNYQVIFQASAVHVENFEEDISILVNQIKLNDGADTVTIPAS